MSCVVITFLSRNDLSEISVTMHTLCYTMDLVRIWQNQVPTSTRRKDQRPKVG
jgi:hypothetical protein